MSCSPFEADCEPDFQTIDLHTAKFVGSPEDAITEYVSSRARHHDTSSVSPRPRGFRSVDHHPTNTLKSSPKCRILPVMTARVGNVAARLMGLFTLTGCPSETAQELTTPTARGASGGGLTGDRTAKESNTRVAAATSSSSMRREEIPLEEKTWKTDGWTIETMVPKGWESADHRLPGWFRVPGDKNNLTSLHVRMAKGCRQQSLPDYVANKKATLMDDFVISHQEQLPNGVLFAGARDNNYHRAAEVVATWFYPGPNRTATCRATLDAVPWRDHIDVFVKICRRTKLRPP